MDLKTRAALVRGALEEKRLTRDQQRRQAGLRSARATFEEMDAQPQTYRQPYTRTQPDYDPESRTDVQVRIDRRIARRRRGAAVRGLRLTRRTDVANPDRPRWARRDRVGVVPRPGRDVRKRILERVDRDAPARTSVIHHGLTQQQILAREPRIRAAERRRRRMERRYGGTAI
ncbi:MAG TPA: hypothetical protein PKY87_15430 [Terricaulis sp.]|nr:hypothetical protein [Terricaulis sp.]